MKRTTITAEMIADITTRLAKNRRVRRTLPADGRIHIDRQLPFLLLYRRPTKTHDEGTAELITGAASYLITTADPKRQKEIARLVHAVVQTLSRQFGAFVIIELFASRITPIKKSHVPLQGPAFQILTPGTANSIAIGDALDSALRTIRIHKIGSHVATTFRQPATPRKYRPLLTPKQAEATRCLTLSVGVQPIYQHHKGCRVYPLLHRSLKRHLTRALQTACATFARTQTKLRPMAYQVLGRRAFVKAVWEVDRRLANLSSQFDVLLQVSPLNLDAAWLAFKRKRYAKKPLFYYRPHPIDPSLMKRELYAIPIHKVEDPTLVYIFTEARAYLDRQLTLLAERDTARFVYESVQLFGSVDPALLHQARNLLHQMPRRTNETYGSSPITAALFARRARQELAYYRRQHAACTPQIEIRSDFAGLMVSRGNLLVGDSLELPAKRMEALLQHEVGTHVVTYVNGRAQPLHQLYIGLPGYDELQEGLAVLAEYLVGGLSKGRLRLLAGRVVAVHALLDGASFVDCFRLLHDQHDFARHFAFQITSRVYRGGGLTKDVVYLRGLHKLLAWLGRGNDLRELYIGKIAVEHMPLIRELTLRKVLVPPPLMPRFLQQKKVLDILERLKQGCTIADLIGGKR